jgi:hypothetical protein
VAAVIVAPVVIVPAVVIIAAVAVSAMVVAGVIVARVWPWSRIARVRVAAIRTDRPGPDSGIASASDEAGRQSQGEKAAQ